MSQAEKPTVSESFNPVEDGFFSAGEGFEAGVPNAIRDVPTGLAYSRRTRHSVKLFAGACGAGLVMALLFALFSGPEAAQTPPRAASSDSQPVTPPTPPLATAAGAPLPSTPSSRGPRKAPAKSVRLKGRTPAR